MDEYRSKKNANRVGVSVRTSRLALGDMNHDPRRSQCCNRLGCSIDTMNGGHVEKPKHLRPNVRASSSKTIAGSSSSLFSSPVEVRKLQKRSQSLTSSKESSIASSSHSEEFIDVLYSSTSTSEHRSITFGREEMGDASTPHNTYLMETSLEEMGKLPEIHGSNLRKYQRPDLGNHSFPYVSSGHKVVARRHSFSPRNHGEPSEAPPGFGASSSRYDLGRLNCATISEVPPSRYSIPGTKAFNGVRKSDASVSSGRERNINSLSPMHNSSSNVSSRSNLSSLHSPRMTNRPSTQRGVTSVRTRRPPVDSRMLSASSSNNNVCSQSHLSLPAESQIGQSNNSSMDLPSFSSRNSFGTTDSAIEISGSRQITLHEGSSSHGLTGLSINRDGYGRINRGGIGEALLALERIEQDEEFTYEQLLILETNLLLGGFSFHDQHRDLRMDIDNMTYEVNVNVSTFVPLKVYSGSPHQELLALEERMGSVSTALPEESLSKYLRRSFYSVDLAVSETKSCDDDVKCSICQEEYANGDEIGCLQCHHHYHVSCISVWLGMKNWCPVCKAPAASK